ncbi:MAG TPA: hypothetical protein DCS97_06385 [Planctomycetes bacterium]|nr:hypothetical protein [Planctomycetota bacterium]
MSDGPVLHWLASRGFGGMEKLVTLIHGEMRRQGVDSRLAFTTQDAGARVAKLLGAGDHAVWCGSTLGLLRQLPAWKPAHIVHHSGHSLHWLWASRLVRPSAAQHRCFHLGFGAKHDLLHRWTYARLRTCVFPTERSRADGLRLLPIRPEQTVIEPYGVRVPAEVPPATASMADQRIIVVSMSRIDPGKGQLELVRAFAAACAAEPRLATRLQLRLFGHHDAWDPRHVAYHRDLVAAISAANLGDAIELRGHTDDPDGELRRAHALVFTSIDEFFGLALIEAYANGVPALCVRRGSFTELHDESRGLWLDLADPLPGLRALADLPVEQHQAMRAACRERAVAYRLEDRVAALVATLTR